MVEINGKFKTWLKQKEIQSQIAALQEKLKTL